MTGSPAKNGTSKTTTTQYRIHALDELGLSD